MTSLKQKLLLPLIAGALLFGCSSTDEDEETKVAELTEIQARFVPKLMWEKDVGSGVEDYFSRLKPTVAYGKVFTASRGGLAMALDVNTGDKHWSIDLSDVKGERGFFASAASARISGGPVAGSGKVVFGSENGYLYALDANSGAFLWRQPVKGEVIAPPAIDSNTVVVNTASGVLMALNLENGEQLWHAEQDVPPLTLRGISGPAIDSGGVIVGQASGEVGVYILENGQQGWTAEIGEPSGSTELERVIDIDSSPIIFGDKIYAISSRGHLAALDLRSGRVIWKRQYSSFRELALDGNVIYATDVKGHVYAIDRNNGLERWSQLALTNRGVTGPVIHEGYVVVGDFEGYLHWLDPENGDIVARHEVDSSGLYVEAVVNNGILYVQARNGDLQAIAKPAP